MYLCRMKGGSGFENTEIKRLTGRHVVWKKTGHGGRKVNIINKLRLFPPGPSRDPGPRGLVCVCVVNYASNAVDLT